MDKIFDISIDLLNKKCFGKKVYCFGCGKRLFEMINLYQNESFVNNIVGLLDNNSTLFGKKIWIGTRSLEIENPILLSKLENIILIITSDRYKEIYNSLKRYVRKNKIIVYRYPHYYYWWTHILLGFFGRFPCRRQILFCAGDEPHENANEIVTYLNERYTGKKYTVIYLGGDSDRIIENVKYIYSETVRCRANIFDVVNYCRLYAQSKYLCYENQALEKTSKRQCLIYLNHGTIPLKRVADVLKQPEELDVGVCPGEGCKSIYAEQYGIPVSKLIFMMPARTNRMFRKEGALHDLLNANGKKVILWLPTFRQLKGSERRDSARTNPIDLLAENCNEIDACLGKLGVVIGIKKHPREKEEILLDNHIKNIHILRDEQLNQDNICLQDILIDADALITDYSGIAFEFMLMDRPIGYVISDIKEYDRGFAVERPEEYMPGEKINNKEQFLSFINNVVQGRDVFINERHKLMEELFGSNAYDDGAESFIKYINGREEIL